MDVNFLCWESENSQLLFNKINGLQSLIFSCRIEGGTTPGEEPKFIVFWSKLVALFSLFCFHCKSPSPSATVNVNGTMATVRQTCQSCNVGYTWSSQPLVHGKYPAGNILLSFSVLMSGCSISKVLLLFRHLSLKVIAARTFFIIRGSSFFL